MKKRKFYINLKKRFYLCHLLATLWIIFSVYISVKWINDLSSYLTILGSIAIVTGIAYIPGYVNVFNIFSLLLEKQPPFRKLRDIKEISILIACKNEEKSIGETLRYIKNQDYRGKVKVFVIDNGSEDNSYGAAKEAAKELNLDVMVLKESKAGKNFALNKALKFVKTDYLVTLDADTILHRSALRYLIMRMESSRDSVSAVAGAILTRNSRENFLCKMQEWEYFLGIASIKRLQGIYEGTLVAQGAFSLYKRESIERIGGWPDAIGEDIVVTWAMLKNGENVTFEPNAVAFTEVPVKLTHLYRQRSRWARGMIEALKIAKPWKQPNGYVKYLTGVNLFMPYIDLTFTLCFIPGLILALFGNFILVGPITLLVLPLALLQNYILYSYQKKIFENLGLRVRKNKLALVFYAIGYQMIMSPISLLGYTQEILNAKRVWR